jgi:NADH-ubiquinone oxidoreductase chain 1
MLDILHKLFEVFIFLSTVLPLIIAVAFFTLIERKIIAGVQRRSGPAVVGV